MKSLKKIIAFLFIGLIVSFFLQCVSIKPIENQLPLEIGEVYYQTWVKDGDSGLKIFVPLLSNPNNIILDSIFFNGEGTKLYQNNGLFVGAFKSSENQTHDMIMSSDPHAEYGNKVYALYKRGSFGLKENGCIISYQVTNKAKYFKVKRVLKK